MKKRKPPVLMASILVVLVGAALYMTVPKGHAEEREQRDPNDAVPTGESRPSPSPKDVLGQIQSSSQSKDPTEAPMVVGGNSEFATVFVPKATPQNSAPQAPSDSAISTQWYRDNARKAPSGG